MPTKNAPPRAYAYELELGDGLCHWAEPTRERLERRSLPSPGATVRAVRIVPEGRYRELLKAEKSTYDCALCSGFLGYESADWQDGEGDQGAANAPAAEEGEGE